MLEGHWAPHEKALSPPVSLLSWLIRNPQLLSKAQVKSQDRRQLFGGDPEKVAEALRLLRSANDVRGWYVFEGPTCPDVFLVTPDALIVVEGKRTESGATTATTWLNGRHQIWRHIDAAWEIRGRRAVYGFFIVESEADLTGGVPAAWASAAAECMTEPALQSSFSHRSALETSAIARCFLGVTTWRRVCNHFELGSLVLPDRLSR